MVNVLLLVGPVLLVGTLVGVMALFFKWVPPGESLVVLRGRRARVSKDPGLAFRFPLIDRYVRVPIPPEVAGARGRATSLRDAGPPSEPMPGHPDVTLAEVCLRAAAEALDRNPRARRATAEDFRAAVRRLEEEGGERFLP